MALGAHLFPFKANYDNFASKFYDLKLEIAILGNKMVANRIIFLGAQLLGKRVIQHNTSESRNHNMKPSKAMIAGAAIAGLLSGSLAVQSFAASTQSKAGTSVRTLADDQKGKHSCKGQNECKGQGGCKASDNGCKGKNSCKGKGGCSTNKPS
jgi:hypothetical protein